MAAGTPAPKGKLSTKVLRWSLLIIGGLMVLQCLCIPFNFVAHVHQEAQKQKEEKKQTMQEQIKQEEKVKEFVAQELMNAADWMFLKDSSGTLKFQEVVTLKPGAEPVALLWLPPLGGKVKFEPSEFHESLIPEEDPDRWDPSPGYGMIPFEGPWCGRILVRAKPSLQMETTITVTREINVPIGTRDKKTYLVFESRLPFGDKDLAPRRWGTVPTDKAWKLYLVPLHHTGRPLTPDEIQERKLYVSIVDKKTKLSQEFYWEPKTTVLVVTSSQWNLGGEIDFRADSDKKMKVAGVMEVEVK